MADVMAEFYDGPHATPKPSESGGVYLGIKNLTESGALDLSQTRLIADVDIPKWTKRVTPRGGDLVFSYEATLHRYAVIPDGFYGTLGRRLALIRVDENVILRDFLLYTFLGPTWHRVVESRMNIGSTVDRIPLTDFPNYPLTVPPIEVQTRIVEVLRAFDDLIENNRRRIEILEEMARLLYREWFVHFRFPGHEDVEMVDSELGPIPDGWRVRQLGELIERLSPGKRYKQADVQASGSVPVVDQSRAELLGFHSDEPGVLASVHEPRLIFGDHTCKIEVLVEPFSVGPNVIPFYSESIPSLALAQLVNGLVETREYKRHWSDLQSKCVLAASESLYDDFAHRVADMTSLRQNLSRQNRVLNEARDLLLPRLVCGELDVSELDLDEVLA